ncbi:MAG: signal recognition particle-docking protein FtsY [Clostridia bacterium]|nr:signal recognition particle-docking protein FtsY [Clostridia bacterium]
MAIFKKINFGLSKTRNKMAGAIDDMLDAFDSFEEDLYTELEEILVMGDVGVNTAVAVVEELKKRVASEKIKKTSEVKQELQNIIADLLEGGEDMGLITIPSVILVIGVNGAGKTTTIGKMAAMYKSQGKKVILAAADTFRAAAIDQLDVWAKRAGVDIIKHKEGADPAAVVYDTIQAGIARDCDIIICDTAGRLHNKKHLMDELGKIYRVMDRELPYADREVLLVLDATTGQNAVNQAREFMNVAELTGIVLTKLDGTARGGVVLSIKNDLKIPVKFIGVGEGLDDLQPFDPAAFAKSLFVESDGSQEDKDENSLEGLVNSEEYQNFVPVEEDAEEDGLREFAEALGAAFGGLGEDEGDAEEESAQSGDDAGQANEPAPEETAQAPYEAEEAYGEADLEAEGEWQERVESEAQHADEPQPLNEEPVAWPYIEEPAAPAPAEAPVTEEPAATVPADEPEPFEPVAEPAPAAPAEEPKKKERRGLFGLFGRHA